VEQQSDLNAGDAPLSRRALREAAERESRRPARTRRTSAPATPTTAPATHRWIPRAAVLTSLAVATIAVPVSAGTGSASTELQAEALDAASPVVELPDAPAEPVGPTATSILATGSGGSTVPASLAQSVPTEERTVAAASRSEERTSLTASGCDIMTMPSGSNGNLSQDGLCELWGTGKYVRADAADALTALNEAYKAAWGENMLITDGYRTLASQVSLKGSKGGLAATPGKSEHGWGLAVDLNSATYSAPAKFSWLKENGPKYGWDNPAWARPGGSGAYEPWHWEFTEGVENRS
jgi:zinc D-Ala-D-Ala carboxypeptidase